MQHTPNTLVQPRILILLCLSSTDVTSPVLSVLVCILWGRVGNSYMIREQTGSAEAELAWRGVLFGQQACFNFLSNLNAFRQIVHSSINLVPSISTLLLSDLWSLALEFVTLRPAALSGPFFSRTLWFEDTFISPSQADLLSTLTQNLFFPSF